MLVSFRATRSPSVFETHRSAARRDQLVVVGVGEGECMPDGILLDPAGEDAFNALVEHGAGIAQTMEPQVMFVPIRGSAGIRDRIDLALDCCAGPFALLYFVCSSADAMKGVVAALDVQSFRGESELPV